MTQENNEIKLELEIKEKNAVFLFFFRPVRLYSFFIILKILNIILEIIVFMRMEERSIKGRTLKVSWKGLKAVAKTAPHLIRFLSSR